MNIAFICTHNACRSQIAEALAHYYHPIGMHFYSAGSQPQRQINQDAVRLMKELYGIDMEKTQYSKTIAELPTIDVAISMGCGVTCPFIGRDFDEDWGLEDPSGHDDETFKRIIASIDAHVQTLIRTYQKKNAK